MTEERIRIADHLAHREQIDQMIVTFKNQLGAIRCPEIRARIKAHLTTLRAELRELGKAIERLLCQGSAEFVALAKRLQSFKGVGPILAATLIAHAPELGQLNDKQIAALIGVAPFNHDSGQFRGQRFVDGGREKVRSVLYIATMSAIRHNPALKAFYERLKSRGKKPIVALVASMRKVIVILNAMIRKQEDWKPPTITA